MTTQQTGLFATPTGAQVLGEMQSDWYLFESLFPNQNFKNPSGQLKQLVNLLKKAQQENREVTAGELHQKDLLGIADIFFRDKIDRITTKNIDLFFEKMNNARLYKSIGGNLKTDIEKFILKDEHPFTSDQAKKLQKYFGITDADNKGLSINEIYKLKGALDQSDLVRKLGIKDPERLIKVIENLSKENNEISVKNLKEIYGFEKIRNKNLALIIGANELKDNDRLDLTEEVPRLLEALKSHQQIQQLGLEKNGSELKTQLNRKVKAFERFLGTPGSSFLTKQVLNRDGISPKNVDGLNYLANLHQIITENNLQQGVEKYHELLKNYDQLDPKLQATLKDKLSVHNKDAAHQLSNMLDQYKSLQGELDKVKDLEELINLTSGIKAKRDGLHPDKLKELGFSKTNHLNGISGKLLTAKQAAENAGALVTTDAMEKHAALMEAEQNPERMDELANLLAMDPENLKAKVEVIKRNINPPTLTQPPPSFAQNYWEMLDFVNTEGRNVPPNVMARYLKEAGFGPRNIREQVGTLFRSPSQRVQDALHVAANRAVNNPYVVNVFIDAVNKSAADHGRPRDAGHEMTTP